MKNCPQCINCGEDCSWCNLYDEPLDENDSRAETCKNFEEK
jgi:hypothetical protein